MQKVTISGSYRTKNNEVVNYSDITGIVPDCDNDTLISVMQNRYAAMWLNKSKDIKERVYSIREVYIDSIENVKGQPSFVGKDIKELSFEEMQDLATQKGLRKIPLWRSGSLRDAQLKAYKIYSSEILKKKMPVELVYSELPSIIIDGDKRVNDFVPESEVGDNPTEIKEDKSALTFEDLKKIADNRGIKYHPNIGYDTLYAKIYG